MPPQSDQGARVYDRAWVVAFWGVGLVTGLLIGWAA